MGLDLAAGTRHARSQLSDRSAEFPRIDPAFEGRANRTGWSLVARRPPRPARHLRRLARYDLADRRCRAARFRPRARKWTSRCSSPAPARPREADGWIGAYVYDRAADASRFVLLDAIDLAAPPVAEIDPAAPRAARVSRQLDGGRGTGLRQVDRGRRMGRAGWDYRGAAPAVRDFWPAPPSSRGRNRFPRCPGTTAAPAHGRAVSVAPYCQMNLLGLAVDHQHALALVVVQQDVAAGQFLGQRRVVQHLSPEATRYSHTTLPVSGLNITTPPGLVKSATMMLPSLGRPWRPTDSAGAAP